MTQGSKAIRLMGNDSSGNGPMSISRLSSGFESRYDQIMAVFLNYERFTYAGSFFQIY
jgi:hypothetical protein